MPGDFSRKTFNPKKHYSGVQKQQGRVDLDADWNEELDILQHRTHTETKDVIGASGVPKKGVSFKITVPASGNNLLIEKGHMYVDGLLCENEDQVTYFNQPYYPNPDGTIFNLPPGSPPSPPNPELAAGTYIAYIDAWQREVNYLDNPLIHEVALGEADTATRLQNVWQVKLLAVNSAAAATCKTVFPEWNTLITPSTGQLNAQTKKVIDPLNPCVLPPRAGYQRLENQLYRIEVQKGGNLANTRFKWSRNNATIETIIKSVNGSILTVEDTGKDEVLGFTGGQWVEIVDEESTLKSTPRQLIQILSVDPAIHQITLSTSNIPNINNGKLKLRGWDQSVAAATADGIPAAGGWIDIEDGVQVSFSVGNYRAGDYWLIPARTATGEIEWPPFNIPNLFPVAQLPLGIKHHYCRLALVKVSSTPSGKMVEVEDCRPKFPSLTEICAEDVCYNNSNCSNSTAQTVQQALDELCQKRENCSTFTVVPGPGWEKVFTQIQDGQDAHICFQIGTYPLNNKVIIPKKGNLKLTGCGPGTKIIASRSEACLVFDGCRMVIVRDLYAETGRTGTNEKNETKHLNGTLTFLNCFDVQVESVNLKCASGTSRAATCITVRNDRKSFSSVNILESKFQVGFFQQGILLVNAKRATVENNELSVYKNPGSSNFEKMLKDKNFRANARTYFSYYTTSNRAQDSKNPREVKLELRESVVAVKSASIRNLLTWAKRLKLKKAPRDFKNQKDYITYIEKTIDRYLMHEKLRNKVKVFGESYELLANQSEVAMGTQAITVGGDLAEDIRILNNTISGFLQGIHVGLSHQAEKIVHDISNVVTIAGNSIQIIIPAFAGRLDRHGIFVGNNRSLLLENNNISIKRLKGAERIKIQGIKIWGVFGERLMVAKNYVHSSDDKKSHSFDTGILINQVSTEPALTQWVVMWNMVPSRSHSVQANSSTVIIENNTP